MTDRPGAAAAAQPPSDAVRTIVFSHANGFPASTYRKLFEQWQAAGYEVRAIEKFGHDPRYPVTREWPHLRRQLGDFIDHEVGRPAYLVGHSLGGYLSLLAALHHPRFVRGVVLLDSPVLHGSRATALRWARAVGVFAPVLDRVLPSAVAAQRRQLWGDLDEVRRHFGAKPKFARWHPSILADYAEHGTEPEPASLATAGASAEGPQARRLAFRREIESEIYSTIHTRVPAELQRHPPRCPVAFIAGRASREIRQVGLAGTRRLVGARLSWLPGSHLYPFERPVETASEVLRWLADFAAQPERLAGPRPIAD